MMGAVAGLVVGSIGGVGIGLLGMINDRLPLPTVGGFLFAVCGGLLTVLSWGRQLTESESPWRLVAYGASIAFAAAYAAAAGRRTANSIQSIVESVERESRLERLDPPR